MFPALSFSWIFWRREMVKLLRPLVNAYATDKTKRKALKSLEESFRGTFEEVCPFCGEKKEVSGYYVFAMLKEKGQSHPQLLSTDAPWICRECAYTVYLLPTLRKMPRFFACDGKELVEIERGEDLDRIPPMSVVIFFLSRGNRFPAIFTAVPSPAPRRSITLNVVKGGECLLLNFTKEGLLAVQESGRPSFRSVVVKSIADYFKKNSSKEVSA